MGLTTIIIIVPLLIILLWFVATYNRLTRLRNDAENAFASVDVYLKKRFDLIPNLVAAVQQYMDHEKSVLTEITALRSRALQPGVTGDEMIDINNKMNRALHSVNVAVENYPDLKSSTNFLQLQASLNEVEEQLSAARRAYNATILAFNNGVELFPSNLVASIRNFIRKPFLETPEAERANVDVKSLFK